MGLLIIPFILIFELIAMIVELILGVVTALMSLFFHFVVIMCEIVTDIVRPIRNLLNAPFRDDE